MLYYLFVYLDIIKVSMYYTHYLYLIKCVNVGGISLFQKTQHNEAVCVFKNDTNNLDPKKDSLLN